MSEFSRSFTFVDGLPRIAFNSGDGGNIIFRNYTFSVPIAKQFMSIDLNSTPFGNFELRIPENCGLKAFQIENGILTETQMEVFKKTAIFGLSNYEGFRHLQEGFEQNKPGVTLAQKLYNALRTVRTHPGAIIVICNLPEMPGRSM